MNESFPEEIPAEVPEIPEILGLLETLVRIGAPTFQEKRRSDFIFGWLKEHLEHAGEAAPGRDDLGNVWIDLSGGFGDLHLFDSHIDTVFPYPEPEIKKSVGRWAAPGIFDNTVTCAILMIWARMRARARAAGSKPLPFLLTFTAGEEGEGNLFGVRAMAERFRSRVRDAFAFDLGVASASRVAVGSLRFAIRFQTGGGHSWNDFGRPSALHRAASWIASLETAFPWKAGARSFNVGTLEGGRGINVIAESATLKLDVRSTDPAFLAGFHEWLKKEVRPPGEAADGASLTFTVLGERPAGSLPEDHPLIGILEKTHAALGIPLAFASYSTNGNALLDAGIPTLVTGLALGKGIHTDDEWLDLASIETGWRKLCRLADELAPRR